MRNSIAVWVQIAPPPPPPCPSNAPIQATLGDGSVNVCTVDLGGAFFNSFYCVPCVLPHTAYGF